MKINNRQQLLAAVAISAGALFVGDKFLLSPLIASGKERSAKIAELHKTIERGNQILTREHSIRSRWDQMQTNTLPTESSIAEDQAFQAFDKWSLESRISVVGMRPQWKKKGEDYMTLEVRIDAAGSLQALTQFIYSIENDPMAMKVESVEITSRDNEGQQLSLGLQVSCLLLGTTQP